MEGRRARAEPMLQDGLSATSHRLHVSRARCARAKPDTHWRRRATALSVLPNAARRGRGGRSAGGENSGDPGKTRTSDLRCRKPRLASEDQSLSETDPVNPTMKRQRLSQVLSNLGKPPPRPKKETAAPAGPRDGGENQSSRLPNTCTNKYRAAPLPLTSLRLVGCFTDEGYLFGWEAAR